MSLDIRYEAEDVAAPGGRCIICRTPFGAWHNGFIAYRFDSSNVCTQCVKDDICYNELTEIHQKEG